MRLLWTPPALADLRRVYAFLAPVNRGAAARAVASIRAGTLILTTQPRIGKVVEDFVGRDVRSILVKDYEVRYEVAGEQIRLLRVFHTREDR